MSDYKLTPSGRIFDALGVEISRDDRNASYRAYAAWLRAGNTPDPIAEPVSPLTADERLALAQVRGGEIIQAFLLSAIDSGVNQAGKADDLYRLLAPVRGPLKDGALHAALDELDAILATPEASRAAKPYSNDAALAPVRTAIVAAITETT